MPWRDDHSPYRVLVSELMLQQTQVARVEAKFTEFIKAFPTVNDLAGADLSDVLRLWQGLGYNRRAKYLHEAARSIVENHGAKFPDTLDELVRLPGVGRNTAGAILAYAFDRRAVFVETNIRTVFFHHYFDGRNDVSDREILAMVDATLPDTNFRQWYWALMDYGSHLKREAGGRLDVSRHYKRQLPLKGSVREVRGMIIKALNIGASDEDGLRRQLNADDRFAPALSGLIKDGLVARDGNLLRIADAAGR